jgi:8-oxo-dGTP diphosphatase
MRQFGEEPTGEVIERPGAYAVIVDREWRVAVVVLSGGVYLPGGGLEGEESAEDALHREVREETGLEVEILSGKGIARQYVPWKGLVVNKIGHYFLCRPGAQGEATETDHVLEWWPGSRAIRELSDSSQRWMVRRALSPC